MSQNVALSCLMCVEEGGSVVIVVIVLDFGPQYCLLLTRTGYHSEFVNTSTNTKSELIIKQHTLENLIFYIRLKKTKNLYRKHHTKYLGAFLILNCWDGLYGSFLVSWYCTVYHVIVNFLEIQLRNFV